MATGVLLTMPVLFSLNTATGSGPVTPISGGLLQFYITGTTTPTPVYTSAALTTALPNPVVANANGQFPAIYLDPTVTYRAQYQNAAGAVIADIDPVSASVGAATQAQVNAGVATGVYVSPQTLAAWTGVPAALGYTPVNKAGDTATNLVLSQASPAALSAGYLGVPINAQNGNYQTALTDTGKAILANSASANTKTIPANATVAYPVGTILTFINIGSAAVTIAPAAGVTLNLAGTGATGNRTLAQWGVATALQVAANQWLISGTGLT